MHIHNTPNPENGRYFSQKCFKENAPEACLLTAVPTIKTAFIGALLLAYNQISCLVPL